jgi:ribonuclease VapC
VILDSSVLVAVLTGETDAPLYLEALRKEIRHKISAATYFETAIVIDNNNDPTLSRQLDDLLRSTNTVIEPFTAEQARIAREAYRDFGKGCRSKAQLNFGDCFAYALAKAMREPLLFKGSDFVHTDIEPAIR